MKIFYIIGKSATGKDTIKRNLLNTPRLYLQPLVEDTTRPMRDGEQDGVEHNYISEMQRVMNIMNNKYAESRSYEVINEDGNKSTWYYATPAINVVENQNTIFIGSGPLKAYEHLLTYYGPDIIKPIYIEVDDKDRLTRSILRESGNKKPNYSEVCRRYLEDEKDFAEYKIGQMGINSHHRFKNGESIQATLSKVSAYIIRHSSNERAAIQAALKDKE